MQNKMKFQLDFHLARFGPLPENILKRLGELTIRKMVKQARYIGSMVVNYVPLYNCNRFAYQFSK